MKAIVLTLIIVCGCTAFAQSDSVAVKNESKPLSQKEQRELDWSHSGMGITFVTPSFGKTVQTVTPWRVFNVNYAFLDVNIGWGRSNFITSEVTATDDLVEFDPDPIIDGFYPTELRYGRYISVGLNLPISRWGIGRDKSYLNSFRLTPLAGISVGGFKYWTQVGTKKERESSFGYVALTPGVRLRAPFVTFDFNVDIAGGLSDDFHLRDWGFAGMITPRLTARFDGLLTLLNPGNGYMDVSTFTVESSHTTSEIYKQGGTWYERSTTTYTGTVNSYSAAYRDIGGFFGIGPRLSFQPPRTEYYSTPSLMAGIAAHMRVGPISLGINMEGGRVGHASRVNADEDDRFWKPKFIDKSARYGRGQFNTFQSFLDIGVELNSLLLAFTGTVVTNRGTGTPFFAINAGYSPGFYTVFNQQFAAGEKPFQYENLPEEDQVHWKDPSLSRGGYLGGWYISVDIGALQFRYQSLRYRRAALASSHMMSIAYRIPFWGNGQ